MTFCARGMTSLPCKDVHALLVRKGRHRSRHIRLSCTGMAHRLDVAAFGTWYLQSADWHRVNDVGGHQLIVRRQGDVSEAGLGGDCIDTSLLGTINTLSASIVIPSRSGIGRG